MQAAFLFGFCLLVILGALSDLTRFKIPNFVSYGLILLFAIYAAVFWRELPVLQHLGIGLVIFVMCVVFWQMKWMGGGDVKFLAGIGLWMGPQGALPFCILLSLASAAFLGALKTLRLWNPWFQAHSAVPQFVKTLLMKSETAIPYGLPAAVAALVTMFAVPGL
jgi:prepilin peptidase CpaA